MSSSGFEGLRCGPSLLFPFTSFTCWLHILLHITIGQFVNSPHSDLLEDIGAYLSDISSVPGPGDTQIEKKGKVPPLWEALSPVVGVLKVCSLSHLSKDWCLPGPSVDSLL